jgi:hypothetical protein
MVTKMQTHAATLLRFMTHLGHRIHFRNDLYECPNESWSRIFLPLSQLGLRSCPGGCFYGQGSAEGRVNHVNSDRCLISLHFSA